MLFSVQGIFAQGTLGEYPGAGVGFDGACGYPDAGNSDPGVSDTSLAGNTCGSAFDVSFGAWTETAGGFDITGFELSNYDIDMEAAYGIRLFYGPQNNCCTICLDALIDLSQGSPCGTFGPQANLGSFGFPIPASYGLDIFGVETIPYADMCPNTEYFAQYQFILATAVDLTDPDGNLCAMDDALITNVGTLTTVQTLVAPGTRDPIVVNATTLTPAAAADCGATDVVLDYTADITAGCTVSFGSCSQGLEFEFRAALACADGSTLDITTGPLVNDPTACLTGAVLAGQISLGTAADVCAIFECDPNASLELYATYTFCEADDIVGDGSGNDEAIMSVSIASILAAYNDAACCDVTVACPEFNAQTYGPICNGYDICIGYIDTDQDGIGDAGEDPTGTTMTVSDGIATSTAQAPINDGIFLFDADGDGVGDAVGYCLTVLFDNPTCDPEPYTPLVTVTCPDGTEGMLLGGVPLTDFDILANTFGIPGGTAIYPPLVGVITPPVCPMLPDGSDAVAGNVEVFVADAAGNPTATSCLVVPGPAPACDSDNTGDPAANAVPVQWNPTNDPLFTALAGPDSFSCGLDAVADLSIACAVCEPAECPVTLAAAAAGAGCDPNDGNGFQAPLDLASCLGADGPVGTGFVYDVFLYTPGGVPAAAPAGYENTPIPVAAEFPDPFGDGNLSSIVFDQTCADVIGSIGLINPTCDDAVFTFIYVPFNYALDTDGDLVAEYPTDCQPVRVDYTVSPTLTAMIDADASADCGDVTASLYDAGGVMCAGTEMTVSCANDGDPTDIALGDNGCGPYMISGGACMGCFVPMCSITPDMAANIVCDDNGTPTDPSDDTFTFDITVNGSNTDPAASNTFSDDQGNTGVAYGTTVSYGPFPIAGGNIVVNFTDADDATCTGMMMAAPPATCSGESCGITPDMASNIVCNDNGTPTDPSDDTYTFDITVNGDNPAAGASNTFNDDQGNTGVAYGTTVSYGPFPIAGGNTVVMFTDADDAACTGMMMAAAPPTCSDEMPPMCAISAAVTSMCDDAGTPEDAADDVTTYTVTVTGSNTGAGFTASVAPDAGALTYGTPLTYTVTGTGGLSVVFTDDTDGTCTATVNQASGCGVVENIPTVGEWGLIILGLLMSITAIVGIRARREEEATA